MTIPALDQKFQRVLKIFETQVTETTQFWFAAATMNEVAKRNPDTLSALNLNAILLDNRANRPNLFAIGVVYRHQWLLAPQICSPERWIC